MQPVPGIAELRQICRKDGYIPRISRCFIHPYVSIRLTRIFLICGMDGDVITAGMGLVGVSGALLLLSQRPAFRIAGCMLLLLSWILDHVDGEVLRYQQKSSAYGILLDRFSHIFEHPLTHFCLGWSLAREHPAFMTFGALNAIGILVIMVVEREAKAAGIALSPPPRPCPRRWDTARVLRKAFGVYRGSTMLGYGVIVNVALIVTQIADLIEPYFAFLSVSIYLNVLLTIGSALRTTSRMRRTSPSGAHNAMSLCTVRALNGGRQPATEDASWPARRPGGTCPAS